MQNIRLCVLPQEPSEIYRLSYKAGATGDIRYLAEYGKNVKVEKSSEIMCFGSEVLEICVFMTV